MDIIAAYHEVGSYRGAAEICGTTPKTVRRKVEAHRKGKPVTETPAPRSSNTEIAAGLVRQKVESTQGRISAKRLMPLAVAEGYQGSPLTFAASCPR